MKKHFLFTLLTISGLLLSPVSLADTAGKVYKVISVTTGQTLAMRNTPSADGNTIVSLPQNAKWIVKDNSETNPGWVKIKWNNQSGWIPAENLIYDAVSTLTVEERRRCLNDPKVKDKTIPIPPDLIKDENYTDLHEPNRNKHTQN